MPFIQDDDDQEIQIEYISLDFGVVRINAITSRSINIYNAGALGLEIENIDFNLDNFYLDENISLPLIIPSLESISIQYWFSATEYGVNNAQMHINSMMPMNH